MLEEQEMKNKEWDDYLNGVVEFDPYEEDKGIEFGHEHAARNFAYQQKAWYNRESRVFFNGKYWVCEVF